MQNCILPVSSIQWISERKEKTFILCAKISKQISEEMLMKQFPVWVDNASFPAGLSQRYYSTFILVIYRLFFLLTFHQHPHYFYFPFNTECLSELGGGEQTQNGPCTTVRTGSATWGPQHSCFCFFGDHHRSCFLWFVFRFWRRLCTWQTFKRKVVNTKISLAKSSPDIKFPSPVVHSAVFSRFPSRYSLRMYKAHIHQCVWSGCRYLHTCVRTGM